jgi:PIF1-like helicase
MLLAFFEKNRKNEHARQYFYKDFPMHFTWDATNMKWNTKQRGGEVGRLVTTNPAEGERYYLRILLIHVKGLTCFEDLLTVNGIRYQTFQKAALERGLIETDDSLSHCLNEASIFQFPIALRRFFTTILVFCEPCDVRKLWDEHYESMSEDYRRTCGNDARVQNIVLSSIKSFLQSMGKNLQIFDLPDLNECFDSVGCAYREINEEFSIMVEDEHLRARDTLNGDQKIAFDEIIQHVNENKCGVFFVDGPGGTGKSFLYKTLLAEVRSRGLIAIVTASSGVVANNLPGGRTVHSRFKIPLQLENNSMCNIKKQSGLQNCFDKLG